MDILFLDANVFFAASASGTGASAFLFQMAIAKKIVLVSSRYAIAEAKINIQRKCKEKDLIIFYSLIGALTDVDVKDTTADEKLRLEHLIAAKDLPILASALRVNAHFLITLDKKDFMTDKINSAALPIIIKSPGDYLKNLTNKP